MNDKNLASFLILLRAGLWGKEVDLPDSETIEFTKILHLAEEQSVVGLVTEGLDHIKVNNSSISIPQKTALNFLSCTLQIEQRNIAMNVFVARIIEVLRNNGVYALLIKGQGIAQCYERPLWRSSGDVDLFLSEENYKIASKILSNMASSIEDERTYKKHLGMTIDGWLVELHGTLRSGLWKRIDKELDNVQNEVFCGGKVRSWMNGRTQIFLPTVDEDVFFVFAHILQHFFKEGIGLRQICDWCRLLYSYREELDVRLLESRIREMGAMTEWKAFYNLASRYLGMPDLGERLMVRDSQFDKKADRILKFVLGTGNFGHNRDYSYQRKYPYVVMKTISLWKHLQDFGRYFVIFPFDSIKVTWRKICVGVAVVVRGKMHE